MWWEYGTRYQLKSVSHNANHQFATSPFIMFTVLSAMLEFVKPGVKLQQMYFTRGKLQSLLYFWNIPKGFMKLFFSLSLSCHREKYTVLGNTYLSYWYYHSCIYWIWLILAYKYCYLPKIALNKGPPCDLKILFFMDKTYF